MTMGIRKTSGTSAATWSQLPTGQQALLLRLCIPQLVGIWVGHTDAPTRRLADALLTKGLVQWRDGVLRVTAEGLRLVVQESGRWKQAVG